MVGHPPLPALNSSLLTASLFDKSTSPKLTPELSANALVTVFQAGACFSHHPHPGDATKRTSIVFPESISFWTVSSKLDMESFVA